MNKLDVANFSLRYCYCVHFHCRCENNIHLSQITVGQKKALIGKDLIPDCLQLPYQPESAMVKHDTPLKNQQQQPTKKLPITPTAQTITMFPSLPTQKSARCSRENSAVCSSSSSLYETNLAVADDHYYDGNNVANIGGSSFAYSSDDHNFDNTDEDDETDTDLETDITSRYSSVRRSHQLFNKKQVWDTSSTKSPTYTNSILHGDHFSSPINENTPIFKRIVSRNSLKPQLKSFRRISAELQHESVPLENEICHEKLILLSLKDEAHFGGASTAKNDKGIDAANDTSKIDIIRKANENWNLKKNGNLMTNQKIISKPSISDIDAKSSPLSLDTDGLPKGLGLDFNLAPTGLRKRSHDNEVTTPTTKTFSSNKRRAVSTSPISAGILKRGNIKLISKASKELEKMSLN